MNNSVSVVLKKVDVLDMQPLILRGFSGDEELLSHLHISPGSLDHCVRHTLNFVMDNVDFYKGDLECYSVVFNGNEIGYTIVIRNENAPNELYSFAIHINYRKKEILQAWLAEIEKIIGKPYFIVLWAKNTRAIDFFEKNGFEVDRERKYLQDATKTMIICQQEAH